MAENKTRPTKANVSAFLRGIESAKKRAHAREILAMMRAATGNKPVMWGPSIIGFGNHRYCTPAGRTGDMPVVAYSPRKAAHVLYIMPGFQAYEAVVATLGKHTKGKSCLYVKSLDDIDRAALRTLIHSSVRHMRAKSGAHDAPARTTRGKG